MGHMPTTPRVIPPGSVTLIVNVRDYGAVGDGVTDDTAAIQAAIDRAKVLGNDTVVYFPQSFEGYAFTNLKLWAYSILHGSRMAQCILRRIAGSTGNAITEYTTAEGNPNGARTIWIQDLGIDGNGTSGNGIDLGYGNVGVNFETWASLQNVWVTGFTSGTGIHIGANAISMSYVYAILNYDGVHVTGGYSQFHTVYAEQNTRYQIRAAGTGHVFVGIHCEVGARAYPAILVEGGAQSFYGVTIYFSGNQTGNGIIEIASGANKNQFHDVYFSATGGATFTHGIYCTAASNGRTGTDTYIQHYEMGENTNVASWYVNVESNKVAKRLGDTTTITGLLQPTDLYVPGAAQIPTIIGPTTLTESDTDAQFIVRCTGAGGHAYTFGAGATASGIPNKFYLLDNGATPFSGSDVIATLTATEIVLGAGATMALRIGGSTGPIVKSGSGSPETVVTAPIGSLYLRTDGGAGTSMYVKESGTGNTGWIAK